MPNQDAIEDLNNLIQTSEDGRKGSAEAAKEATAPELNYVFHQRAQDCAAATTELQTLVKTLGATPKDGGTITGAAHRGWTKLKATVGDANIGTLEEVESAEDKAKAIYAKALTPNRPPHIHSVVQRQHEGTVRNHDLIRDLRNSYKADKEGAAI